MSIFTVGRLCVKLAGRDAGNKCVVVEDLSAGYVVIDGAVRRKKVNIKHLEPLAETIDLKNKASHDEVKSAFEALGIKVWDKKSKKPTARTRKQHKRNEKSPKSAKKPVEKKEEQKKEEIKDQAEQVKAETLTGEASKEKIATEKESIKQEKEELKKE